MVSPGWTGTNCASVRFEVETCTKSPWKFARAAAVIVSRWQKGATKGVSQSLTSALYIELVNWSIAVYERGCMEDIVTLRAYIRHGSLHSAVVDRGQFDLQWCMSFVLVDGGCGSKSGDECEKCKYQHLWNGISPFSHNVEKSTKSLSGVARNVGESERRTIRSSNSAGSTFIPTLCS